MYYLSWWIGQFNNRPVVDKTGRTGPNGEPVDGPSLATALREQLGLKLDSEKTQVEV